ncbi:asparagine synthetase B, partial [Streptomyces sp. PRKS01-29]|nr:asparagine synthetase B [Streptomyces sabulosicollis]
VLCLDGRLYNRGDLQAQLRDLPRSCSDARLLLQAIVEWGVQRALSRIEGAFGFSVWDRESRVLWLARDPVGERPLYYGWYQGQFLFASELKALQAFAGFASSIDQDALSLLLRHDYVPAPHTIYRGIHKLVAGAMLRIDLSDHAAGCSSQA